MNKKTFIEEHKAFCEQIHDIVQKKNNDYAGNEDAWKNFTLCEHLSVTNTENGIMTRILDKVSRVCNLLNNQAQVKDESIQDTLKDLANYTIILSLYLKDKHNAKTSETK